MNQNLKDKIAEIADRILKDHTRETPPTSR